MDTQSITGFKSYLVETKCPPSQLVADMDDNVFANILNNPHHVLYKFLRNKTDRSYNLRSRRHSLSLTVKTDCNNFLNRLLFKDID